MSLHTWKEQDKHLLYCKSDIIKVYIVSKLGGWIDWFSSLFHFEIDPDTGSALKKVDSDPGSTLKK